MESKWQYIFHHIQAIGASVSNMLTSIAPKSLRIALKLLKIHLYNTTRQHVVPPFIMSYKMKFINRKALLLSEFKIDKIGLHLCLRKYFTPPTSFH